jgi:glycosyltransferase involved in cell wall biosynthesis
MRVALDATPLSVSTGGVARYTSELACALASRFPEDEYWMVSDQPFDMPVHSPPNLRRGGGPRSLVERRWWLWGLERELARHQVELFHGTDFSVPYLRRRPSVMTLHDLSPWMDRRWQPDAERIRLRTPVLLRLGLATRVITPTEAVRQEAINRFALAPERVIAVPLAASSWLRPVAVESPAPTPYFLFVGTIEPRKCVPGIIEAWREVRQTERVDVILVGRTRKDATPISPQEGLHILGAVHDERLAGLYSGALAVLYPSLYEGFGLPVLEAMQCGALAIISRDPALREVSGGAAISIDAQDTRALAEAMRAVIRSPEAFHEIRTKALERAAQFSWTRTAELTHKVYEDACRRFRH